jgi:hypothetical protein
MNAKVPSKGTSSADVDAFLDKVALTPKTNHGGGRGRLLFAMDATASRQPTWDRAAHIQGEMFHATSALGGLDVQLAFFRGFGEFKVSQWTNDGAELTRMMSSVSCFAGETQIGKILKHALNESGARKVNALVYVGDSMEEDIDALGTIAGELGLNGVPVFIFQEGSDPIANYAFKEIARLSGGACVQFDANSADALKKLLGAVAVFAAGGHRALSDLAKREGGPILSITHQLKK